jgi:hypothetical protein
MEPRNLLIRQWQATHGVPSGAVFRWLERLLAVQWLDQNQLAYRGDPLLLRTSQALIRATEIEEAEEAQYRQLATSTPAGAVARKRSTILGMKRCW